jgi:hypothetical protein
VQTMIRAWSDGPSFLRQSSNVPAAANSKSSKWAWTQRIFMLESGPLMPILPVQGYPRSRSGRGGFWRLQS